MKRQNYLSFLIYLHLTVLCYCETKERNIILDIMNIIDGIDSKKGTSMTCYSLISADPNLNQIISLFPTKAVNIVNKPAYYEPIPSCPYLLWFAHGMKEVESQNMSKQIPTFYKTILVFQNSISVPTLNNLVKSNPLQRTVGLLLLVPATNYSYNIYTHDLKMNQVKLIDLWDEDHVFYYNADHISYENLKDFNGRSLRAATFDYAPFTTRIPDSNIYDGIEFRTLDEIAMRLNFKIDIRTVPNKWPGIIEEVTSGQSDIGIAHFFLTHPRASVMDHTPTINTDYYCFLVAKSKLLPKWLALVLPLHYSTWIALGVVIVISMVFFELYKIFLEDEVSSSSFAFFLYSILLECSTLDRIKFRWNGIQIFTIIFVFGCFIVTVGFKGSLVSYLTHPPSKKPIDSLSEVVESPLEVKSLSTVVKRHLHESTNPLLLKLNEKYFSYSNLIEGFTNVTQEKVIVAESVQMSRYRIKLDFTNRFGEADIHIAKECIQKFDVVIYLQKNSIYREAISNMITRLKEAGITQKHLSDSWTKARSNLGQNDPINQKDSADTPMRLEDFQGPFYILVTLWLISLLIALVEHYKRRSMIHQ